MNILKKQICYTLIFAMLFSVFFVVTPKDAYASNTELSKKIPDSGLRHAIYDHMVASGSALSDNFVDIGPTEEDMELVEGWEGSFDISDSGAYSYQITDLTGLECLKSAISIEIRFFTDLNMDTLNISNMPNLEYFFITYCWSIDTINISNLPKLKSLIYNHNRTNSLHINNTPLLEVIESRENGLSILNISGVPKLGSLECTRNILTSLNLNNLSTLSYLDCGYNQFTSIDVSNLPQLTSLNCRGNLLSSLNVNSNEKLISLNCNNNLLASLNVDNNNELEYLSCEGNLLKSLKIHNKPSLNYLSCAYNQLTVFEIGNLPGLTQIYCHNNQLARLDLQAATNCVDYYLNQSITIALSYKGNGIVTAEMPLDSSDENVNIDTDKTTNVTWSGKTITLNNANSPGKLAYFYNTGGMCEDEPMEMLIEYKFTTNKSTLNKTSVAANLSTKTYNGKAFSPAVTIKHGSIQLIDGIDYIVQYTNNTNPGEASVLISGKGYYRGSKTLNFQIKPQKTTIKKSKSPKKKQAKIFWKKSTGVDGYYIVYSKNKKT